jgi:hypothetical protein
MKTNVKNLVWLYVLTIVITTSCEKDNPEPNPYPTPDFGYISGYYIVNEGPFMTGTGTIDFVTRTGKKYQNVYLTSNDGQVLGNLVQSVAVIGVKTYIVVNNADKIEVVDTKTFKKTGTFNNLPSPRYIIEADDNSAFVSCIGDNSVKIINLNGFEIIGSLAVNAPEKMMRVNNTQIWVLSQGGFSVDSTISVIDIASKSIVQTIQVYPQPSGIQQDKNGNIWVMCSGRNSWHPGGNSEGHLVCINPDDYSISKDIIFPTVENHPEELVIRGTKDVLYYRYPGGIYKIGIEASEPEANPLVARTNGFYTLAYDDPDNIIYGTDPMDYVQNGWVYRYNADSGAIIDSIEAGIIPGEIYFLPLIVW